MNEAEAEHPPFEYLMIAHVSALSGNVDTAADLIGLFNSHGIIVCCVSHHIIEHDARDRHDFTMFF